MAKHFGMQVEVIVPPNHPRANYLSPSTVEALVLANPHLHQAAQKLCKRVPSHFYTLQMLQRNYQIAKKAHTIYAFGILEKDAKQVFTLGSQTPYPSSKQCRGWFPRS